MNELPHSPAAMRNREPILTLLKEIITKSTNVLEIGHGTGEHALYFSEHLPHLTWQPADTHQYNWILEEKIKTQEIKNLCPPIEFEVNDHDLSHYLKKSYEVVYSANTLHIMSEDHAKKFCKNIHKFTQSKLLLYGPFKFHGKFTSLSNQDFDQSLKNRDERMGIRDFKDIEKWLKGFKLNEIINMPANNNLLIFDRL